jgi:hypothetical protein
MSSYFSILPAPKSSTANFHSSSSPPQSSSSAALFQSLESLNQEESSLVARSGSSTTLLATASLLEDYQYSSSHNPTPLRAYRECMHPEDQLDTESGVCHSCGAYTERLVAPLTECGIGFGGGSRHAVSSASAAAKRRRQAAAAAEAKAIVMVIEPESGGDVMLSSAIQHATVASLSQTVPETTKANKDTIAAAVPICFETVEFHAVLPPTARVTCATEKTMTGISRRIIFLSQAAKFAFHSPASPENEISLIPSGACRFQDRDACPAIERLALSVEKGQTVNAKAVELSDAVIDYVGQFVQNHISYFNSSQRRRLHHLSLFVAIVGAHAEIIHGSNMEEAGACFEIDRVLAKARPSQSRFRKRSFAFVVAERLGISVTCSTRLVQEVLKLIKG